MSDAQRVIDEIDALVEEQLRGGEPETGYDFDDPDFPECRCGLNWHGLPTSVCPGSDTEGPLRLPGLTFCRRPDVPVVIDQQAIEAYAAAAEELRRVVLVEWERISGAVEDTWATIRAQLGAIYPDAAQTADRKDGRPALPTPARTPPMWAVDATRSRRRRQ